MVFSPITSGDSDTAGPPAKTRSAEKQKHKPWLSRLEELALTALHTYPTLYCSSGALQADTPAAFIVSSFREELVAKLSAMPNWEHVGLILIYPPAMILIAAYQTACCGRRISRMYHRSIIDQFLDQMSLSFKKGVPARFYYLFELHESEKRPHASTYIHRAYLKPASLYRRLYRLYPERGQGAKILNNKEALDFFLREHKLPATQLIATAKNGLLTLTEFGSSSLPPVSLFAKPVTANGGRGAERWNFREGLYINAFGASFTATGLAEHLAGLSLREPYVVQECLQNHPALRDLSTGATSTLRMYTFSNEKNEVEHIFSMLRMSRDVRSPVDNVCKGGLAAAVDPATGALGFATDESSLAKTGWLDRHPATGTQIAGRRIPYWTEAVDLVKSAHQLLSDPILVGWDVAITQAGPVIVEGNKAPDIEIEQRLSGPWGNQRFGQLLAFHLRDRNIGPT